MPESRGQFRVPRDRSGHLASLQQRLVDVLRDLGFKAHRKATHEDGFSVVGTRGSVKRAVLGTFIPLNELLGLLTRVRVQIQVRRSLKSGDQGVFLFLRIWPEDELLDTRERWGVTQSPFERIGDGLQTRRVYRKIVNALAANGIIHKGPSRPKRSRGRVRGTPAEWLREVVVGWRDGVKNGTESSARIRRTAAKLKRSPDFARLEDPAFLARLRPAEQEVWRELWGIVDALLERTRR